jgi:hypothetical protein
VVDVVTVLLLLLLMLTPYFLHPLLAYASHRWWPPRGWRPQQNGFHSGQEGVVM